MDYLSYDVPNLSPETIRKCIDTLIYLDSERRSGFQIDAINMDHVTRALAMVEAEQNIAAERARNAAPMKHRGEVTDMADQSTIQPKPARRHYCTACGNDIGAWDKYSHHGDTCGKFRCEQAAREEDREDRADAHERLDRDMGWR